MFYSGTLLWVEIRRRKQARDAATPPPQRRDTRLMAAATVGVCLGCICGISLALVGGKWLYALGGSEASALLYYSAFFAAIAWAFLAGAGRAAVHLLWLACALTLAIPLTALTGAVLPGSGRWAHGSPASRGVDLPALAGAGCFALMARATRRRLSQGRQDSVWAAPSRQPGDAPGQGAENSSPV